MTEHSLERRNMEETNLCIYIPCPPSLVTSFITGLCTIVRLVAVKSTRIFLVNFGAKKAARHCPRRHVFRAAASGAPLREKMVSKMGFLLCKMNLKGVSDLKWKFICMYACMYVFTIKIAGQT